MPVKMTVALRNHTLATGSVKDALDGGRLYLFAGTVPATAEAALDIGTTHTLVAEVTESDDGVTDLTFDATAADGVLQKAGDEDWEATAAATATMTFFRFCENGDNGEGAASTTLKRIQGTIGPNGSYDLQRPNPTVSASDPITINMFAVALPAG
jgi:hypothetical protein